jgi:homoserine dehydrogenase
VKTIKIGMLGCGVVGGSVARELASNSEDLAARSGAKLDLIKIAVRKLGQREGISEQLFTTDANSVVTDPNIELIIEVMGGIEPAREMILKAIQNGKSVVTANKALLASHGADLYAAAEKAGVDLYYEAAVAGAIPIIRPLRESLVGDRINRVMGIVNGTTNFILTKMDEEGLPFDVVLKEAQALGYAEADPTSDVEGHDAAAKAAILAGLAFHTRVTANDVACEGISKLTAQDVATAKAMNKVIKLIAEAKRTDQGIAVRVCPMMLDRSHPLASVREAFNAVFVESEGAGQLMFYGRGAGGSPTASAVLGDVVAVSRHIVAGSKGPAESDYADLGIAPQGAAFTKYAIRLSVNDKPGVLASVANTFASENVSIQTVRQTGRGDEAELTVVTHRGTEAALQATVKKLAGLDVVREIESVIRVEGSAS